jgi:molecular chaperone DnaK (HSP70)
MECKDLIQGNDFKLNISRVQFESLCTPIFRKIIVAIENLLRSPGFTKGRIHDIILSGGSSSIPMIQKYISEFFNSRPLIK